jgi:hypothetical protein
MNWQDRLKRKSQLEKKEPTKTPQIETFVVRISKPGPQKTKQFKEKKLLYNCPNPKCGAELSSIAMVSPKMYLCNSCHKQFRSYGWMIPAGFKIEEVETKHVWKVVRDSNRMTRMLRPIIS